LNHSFDLSGGGASAYDGYYKVAGRSSLDSNVHLSRLAAAGLCTIRSNRERKPSGS